MQKKPIDPEERPVNTKEAIKPMPARCPEMTPEALRGARMTTLAPFPPNSSCLDIKPC